MTDSVTMTYLSKKLVLEYSVRKFNFKRRRMDKFKSKATKPIIKKGTIEFGATELLREVLENEKFSYVFLTDMKKPMKKLKISHVSEAQAHKSDRNVFQLRKYQAKAMKRLLRFNRGIGELATNAGKTMISFFLLLNTTENRSLIVCNSKQLAAQTYEKMQEFFGVAEVGICGSGKFKLAKYMICIDKSLNEERIKAIGKVDTVVIDEVHNFSTTTGKKILKAYKKCRVYGMSATADDHDDKLKAHDVLVMFGPKRAKISNSELVDLGVSSKGEIHFVDMNVPFYPSENLLGTENPDERYRLLVEEGIVRNALRNSQLIMMAKEQVRLKRPTVLLVQRIEHGMALSALASQFQIKHEFIQGSSKDAERKSAIRRFKSGRIKLLIATTIFDTGISVDEIECIINAGAGKSSIKSIQRLGRIVRKKEVPFLYIDTYDCFDRTLLKQSKVRMKAYEDDGAYPVKRLSSQDIDDFSF